ncbi:MAG: urea carboxylase-associated family protein, partial [Hydrogenophaga sp.]|nr:urea carboxylase-associated family protein [Hydrogenophaga sp.]
MTTTATDIRILESTLDPAHAVMDQRHPAGEPILFAVNKGQTLRTADLYGNPAADVTFNTRDDLAEHYSAT